MRMLLAFSQAKLGNLCWQKSPEDITWKNTHLRMDKYTNKTLKFRAFIVVHVEVLQYQMAFIKAPNIGFLFSLFFIN